MSPHSDPLPGGSHDTLRDGLSEGRGRHCPESSCMLARARALSILRALNCLPEDKLVEVEDFVHYLEQRYAVDESDAWSDDDLSELAAAALSHADASA